MANYATNIFHARTENKTDLDKIEAFLDDTFSEFTNRYGDSVDAEFSSRWVYPEEEIKKLVESLEDKDKVSYNKLKSLVANVEAIETAMKIQVQGRQATAEEKEILSRYSGFGGSAKRRNRSLELARNHRYVPSCIVSLLQPYRPLLAWSQQRIVPLHHPFPWQPFCAVPHTSLQFSSCGH